MLAWLKTTTLSTRVIALVSFLLIMLLLVSAFALLTIHHLEQEVVEMAEEEIPLMRVVAKMTEYQLDQAMRFGEILQYGQFGVKDKFEEEIQDFLEAGQRLNDVIKEGRKLAQHGIEIAKTAAEQDSFERIMKSLEIIEKEHGDYEHHSEAMFQDIMIHRLNETNTSKNTQEAHIESQQHCDGLTLKQVQEVLKQRQFYTKTIDGSWGESTAVAVKRYQADHSELNNTGILDTATCQVLMSHHHEIKGINAATPPAKPPTAQEELLEQLEIMEQETKHIEEEFEELLALVDQLTRTLTREAENEQQRAFAILIPLALFSVLGGLFISVLVISTTVMPLKQAIKTLSDGAEHVSVASQQIATTSEYLSDKVVEQASSVEQISASVEQVAQLSQHNNEVAAQGHSLIEQLNELIQQAETHIHDLNQSVNGLNAFGNQIGQTIKLLNDMAIQVNLLATNATVEATRHEASQGFGIFTAEIKNLSQKSVDRTREIDEFIDHARTDLKKGYELTENTQKTFSQVVLVVKQLTQLVAEIMTDSKQQAHSISEINTVMNTLGNVTHANASSAEESAAAGQSLNEQAQIMQTVVDELVVLVERKRS